MRRYPRPDSAPRSAPRSFLAAMLPWLSSGVDATAALERPPQGDLVGVLQVPTDGQPAGETGDREPHRGHQAGQVGGGRLALDVRVGRDNEPGAGAAHQPGHELLAPQVVGSHTVDRADRAAEHVVAPAELTGALDGHDVLGLLDDAQHVVDPPRVAADPALLGLGDVVAGHAEADLLLHPGQRRDQPADVGGLRREQVERDPLGALGPDARQPPELVDQILDGALVHGGPLVSAVDRSGGQKPGRPRPPPAPPPRPPASGPMVVAASSSAARLASCRAATTRSCSVSRSSGSTAAGAMVTAVTSPLPVMVTDTRPPPAVPVTSVRASCSCAATSCCCICCACWSSCAMSG